MESLDELIDHERSRTEDEIAKDIKKFIQWMQGIEVHGSRARAPSGEENWCVQIGGMDRPSPRLTGNPPDALIVVKR